MIDDPEHEPSETRFQFGLGALLAVQVVLCIAVAIWTWHIAPFVLLAVFTVGYLLTNFSRAIPATDVALWIAQKAVLILGMCLIIASPFATWAAIIWQSHASLDFAWEATRGICYAYLGWLPFLLILTLPVTRRFDDGAAEVIAFYGSLVAAGIMLLAGGP
jgi:hypothetical protein